MQTHFSLQAEIITIGDEILIGQIVDTNSAWMGQHLNAIGIWIHQVASIGDQREEILKALQNAGERVSLVFITGGLGPTRDDITKQTLCEYFDDHLERDENVYRHVEKLLGSRGIGMNELNQKQADFPSKATIVPNICGTAPGLRLEKDGTLYFFMPGVPFEMITMMEDQILPDLKVRFSLPAIRHKTIITQGIGESLLAEKLTNFEDQLPSHLSLAYLPEPGSVKLRLTAMGEDSGQLESDLESQATLIRNAAGEYIISEKGKRVEEELGILLKEKHATIAVAESCTGGYISHLLTSISGSSAYFKGGVVAYSNEVKTSMLDVNQGTLNQYGAVSREVAEEMVIGVKNRLKSDYAISVTGIAGPDGGSDEKPVGTVCIAWAFADKVYSECFHFGDHRDRNIKRASTTAMAFLLQAIRKQKTIFC